MAREDLVGRIFDRLTVVAFADKVGASSRWWCVCSCGVRLPKPVYGNNLKRRCTTSCGCRNRELASARLRVHGYSVGHLAKTYDSWKDMIERCDPLQANDAGKKHYVARGISVCEQWKRSFETFLTDMGPRPHGDYSVDRIDNDGNYEPANCRWATRKEQARNRRSNRRITCRGKSLLIVEWAELTGQRMGLIVGRLRAGWPPEQAIFDEPKTRARAS